MKRAILLIAAALASCAAPDIRPAIAPRATETLGLSSDAGPLVAGDWWRAFGDPQLDRLVADAVGGNPTLDAALARLEQARATLSTRRADTGPDLALDAQEQYGRLSGTYIYPPPYAGTLRFLGTTQANLGLDLDLFGRQRSAIRAARASVDAVALDVTAARLALSASVVQTYLDLARAEAQAQIARSTIEERERTLHLVDVRIRNRLSSKLDAQGAITLLAQARQALVRAEAAQVLSRNALAALAGRGADYPATIAPTALRLDAPLPLPARIPADLLARRADIVAARARIEAATQGREAARRAFYPDVNLTALAGFQAIGIGNLFSLDSGAVSAGPAIHLPLFDSGRLRAGYAGAVALLDASAAAYNDAVIGAVRQAADGIARVQSIEADRARQREIVRGFAETGRLNAVRVASGLDSKLDLVDNDVRTLEAAQTDADLAVDAAQARVALVLALGGGFAPAQDTPR